MYSLAMLLSGVALLVSLSIAPSVNAFSIAR